MFRAMDKIKTDLAIDNYGISVTTLEEVFMRVGHDEEVILDDDEKDEAKKRDSNVTTNAKTTQIELVQQGSDGMTTNTNETANVDTNKESAEGNEDGNIEGSKHDLAEAHLQVVRKYSSNNLISTSEDDVRESENWKKMMDEIRARSQKNLFWQHVKAVLLKKFHFTKRDNRVLFFFFFSLLFLQIQ
ncbi:ATP-binding cassette transporter subfamily A-like protein [Reticulomyxa filosa]|uniref:ATP-binding cassette transporter subfamily A-like protein n=1 Tax=Reticulomyxa filosa TaxID=46433 RepID=X6NR23_RETFI|nr:ATP-binding cassette transporter subfamily A-like protein [Reticulomyxa filosa]|eukprot:ETO28441.1 ATP-binding cassette transporter subfamily A-like protein [Reticulomyxa filosa]